MPLLEFRINQTLVQIQNLIQFEIEISKLVVESEFTLKFDSKLYRILRTFLGSSHIAP